MKDASAIIRSRRELIRGIPLEARRTLEGGCGIIGIEPLEGCYIIRSCEQMRNRGNSKGADVAAAGLFEEYTDHYALHIAYLDEGVRGKPCLSKRFLDRVVSLKIKLTSMQ